MFSEGDDGALQFASSDAGNGLGYQHMALATDVEHPVELWIDFDAASSGNNGITI